MSQRVSRKSLTTNENILYELNDYDRQRKSQILIDDDRIQSVPLDPVFKSLSVKSTKKNLSSYDFMGNFSVQYVSIYSIEQW